MKYIVCSHIYFISDLESEELQIKQLEINGIKPLSDTKETIYLFHYDDTPTSNMRYSIVLFNTSTSYIYIDIETDTWRILDTNGISPKVREGSKYLAQYY